MRVLKRKSPYKIVPPEKPQGEGDRPEFYFTMQFIDRESQRPIVGAEIDTFLRRQDENHFADIDGYETDEKGEIHLPLNGDGPEYSVEVLEVWMLVPSNTSAVDADGVPVRFNHAVNRRVQNREIITFHIGWEYG